jgi:hypothetical protein
VNFKHEIGLLWDDHFRIGHQSDSVVDLHLK